MTDRDPLPGGQGDQPPEWGVTDPAALGRRPNAMNATAVLTRALPWSLRAAVPLVAGLCFTGAAQAQVESFMLKRGSNVGPETQIKPTNCVTATDGSITCDTVIQNSPSDTPAQPIYQPFKN